MNNLPRLLHDIAEQEIPAKEIDMWRKIESQISLNPQVHRQHSWVYNTIVATVVLMILAAIGGGTYAFFQGKKNNGDPGIEGAHDAGLVQSYGTSQSIGDYTITLDEAYADAQRLAVYFTIDGMDNLPPEQQVYVSFTDQDGNNMGLVSYYSTETERGTEFIADSNMQIFGQDKRGNWIQLKDYVQKLADNTLHLKMTMVIAPPFEDYGFLVISPVQMIQLLENDSTLETAVIDFDVPLFGAIILEPKQAITVNNVEVVLDRVEITPTQTTARICFDLPDPHEDWEYITTLRLGEEEFVLKGGSLAKGPNLSSETRRCWDQSYSIFYDATQPTTLVISVDRIQINQRSETPEYWDDVKAELAKQDIIVNFRGRRGIIEIVSLPDGMTKAEFNIVLEEVRQKLRKPIEGPWVFEIPLP